MILRATTDAELELAASFVVDDPVAGIGPDRYRAELSRHQVRPAWTWVAEDDGEVLARAVWWGRHDSGRPVTLDCLHVRPPVRDRAALGAALLTAGHAALTPVPYELAVPDDWREHPPVVEAVGWRHEAARRAGLTTRLERLRFAWTRGDPVPPPAARLDFRPEPDDTVVLDAFRRVALGSLDVATVRGLAALGPDDQARDDLEFYRDCPGERDWWRLGYAADGSLAAVAVPSATPYHRNVGYLGVVPEHRGKGLVDEVLGEITRRHSDDGADRVTATTDATNLPMAAAFRRARYGGTGTLLVHEAPATA